MAPPMGEAKIEPLRVDITRRLKLEFHGGDISSAAGLLPYRDLDGALGPTELGREACRRRGMARTPDISWWNVFAYRRSVFSLVVKTRMTPSALR